MTSTASYAVKRIVIDRLAQQSGDGQVFAGVNVQYALTNEMTDRCIYAGGTVFDQPGEWDVSEGDDVVQGESSTFGLYIRIVDKLGRPVRDVEAEAERYGDEIGAILRKEPRMCGPSTNIRISGGTGDYQNTDDGCIVILALRVTTSAYV